MMSAHEHSQAPARAICAPSREEAHRFHLWMQGALALVATLFTLWTFGRFRQSILWGGILAVICWPLFTRLRLRWNRPHAEIIIPAEISGGVALIFLMPTLFLVSALSRQAYEGSNWIKDVSRNGLAVPEWVDRVPIASSAIKHWWQNNLENPDRIHVLLHHLKTEQALGAVEHVGHGAINTLVVACFALLILFFFLRAGDNIVARIEIFGKRLLGKRSALMLHHVTGAIRGTMAGLVLVGLGEGALITLSYVIAGAPQSLLLGIFTACAAMIPMISGFALALCVVVILLKCSLTAAICVGVFGALILFLGDHFVRPVLIGGSIQLPFMWVLLGILGGLETWGVEGLFIGPVLAALTHLAWRLTSGHGLKA
ncbi:AI-2E family transporter [Acetobacter persici]|uniref:AI-2E family transporter n=1 Tax=Acetobacter persici TaxID=1076596 RepID=UPI0020CFCF35|nr:AI-2E family transporter [Acetobacter persici]